MAVKKQGLLRTDWSQHPSTVEGLVPIWGSAREAAADWHEGDYLGVVGNGVLAVSDVIPAGALAKVGVKAAVRGVKAYQATKDVSKAAKEARRGVVKVGGSDSYRALRYDLGKAGLKPAGTEAHHWLIPQRAQGSVPLRIINQPFNIKSLSPDVHRRIHGSYRGAPRFGPAQRVWHGAPGWAKAGAVSTAGRAVPDTQARKD